MHISNINYLIELFEKYNIPFKKEELYHSFPILVPKSYAISLLKSAKTKKQKFQVRNVLISNISENHYININASDPSIVDKDIKDVNPLIGMTRIYKDRVLISPVANCSVHCPWCFREPVSGTLNRDQIKDIIIYIQKDDRIFDVILTGGEPLLLPPKELKYLLQSLRDIRHVKIIRFHTRLPVVNTLLARKKIKIISEYNTIGFPIIVVLQVVHPLEINSEVEKTFFTFLQEGIQLLNQSPLLKGINDDQETFNEWMQKLIWSGVKPYYLIQSIVKKGVNEGYFVNYIKLSNLVNNYSSQYDGLGRPQIIIPIMGKKYSQLDLEHQMKKHEGIHFRNTKKEIW